MECGKMLLLDLRNFSLQATIDLRGPSRCILVIMLPLSAVAKTFFYNDRKNVEFEIIDTKNSPTAYAVIYKLIT